MGCKIFLLTVTVFILGIGCSSGNSNSSLSPGVSATSALTVTPSPMTVASSSSGTLFTTGGVAPYYYTLISGSGSVGYTTGLYTATSAAGSAEVQVNDSSSPSNVTTVFITISSSGTTGTGGGISPGGTIEIYELCQNCGTTNPDYLYSVSSTEGTTLNPPYVFQQNAFQIYPTNITGTLSGLYRCRTTNISQRHFLSTDPNCEGKIMDGQLGWIYPPSDNGLSGGVALYRFISPNSISYFETINYNSGSGMGYTDQETLGYVFNP